MIERIGGNENIVEDIAKEFRETLRDAIEKKTIKKLDEKDINTISDMVALFSSILIMQYQTELLTELRMKLR